jgi:hypothetical protein
MMGRTFKLGFSMAGATCSKMEMNVAKLIYAISAVALLGMTNTVAAQEAAGAGTDAVKINQVIIYGDDKCPVSTDDIIVVCAALDEKERYRIPKKLRDNPNDLRNQAWASRVKSYQYVGESGIMSCTPTMSGGLSGCGLKDIDNAYAERKEDIGLVFGRLIAQARNERLAGIDAEADKIEEIVKEEERMRAFEKLQQQGNSIEADDGAADAAASAAIADEPLPTP